MPVEYFETRFQTECEILCWPKRFAIITAYATTGQQWTPEENDTADSQLRSKLASLGLLGIRITGYSPRSGHAEPGWAVEVDLPHARQIGNQFRQHAIYYIEEDRLSVVACEEPGNMQSLGSFREKLCNRS